MAEANHEIITAYLDANMVADRAGMVRVMAPDVKMWLPVSGTRALGKPNPLTGRDTVLDMMAVARKMFYAPDKHSRYRVLHAFSSGDMGAVHFHLDAETINGVPYQNDYLMLCRIAAGVIAEFWEFTDTTHAFASFSAPKPG
jgi:ketosteroid isomerase-like protein